jgi:outer membrane protein assembly factor BamB
VTAVCGIGLSLTGVVVLVTMDGVSAIGGWGPGDPLPDPAEISVDLEDAQDAPPERLRAEPGPEAPLGEPLTCELEDCVVWRAELTSVADPRVLVDAERIVVLQPLVDVFDEDARRATADGDPGSARILAVIDATTGMERWQTTIDPPSTDVGALGVAVVGEHLVVTEEPGVLRAFRLDDGAPGWTTTLDEAAVVDQAQLIGSDLLVALGPAGPWAGDAGSRVVAIDADTGVVRWTSETAERVVLTSVGPVLFDAFDRMRGLDPGDGTERWSDTVRTLPQRMLALDGLLVLDRSEASVIDALDGTTLATLPGGSERPTMPVPARDDDGVLVMSLVGVSHVAADGSTWTSTVLGCCIASSLDPATVTVLTERGEVRRFARDDGRELEEPPTGSPEGRDGEAVALMGGYLFTIEGNQRARTFAIEETLGGRPIARFGSGYPVDLTDEGALLFTSPGLRPGDPAQLIALRAPAVPAD